MSLAPSECTCVCGVMQQSMRTKSTTTANEQCGHNDVMEPIVLERHAFSRQAKCDLSPRERPSSWPPWRCVAFAIKLKLPPCVEEIWTPSLCNGWIRRLPHGIKIATFRDNGEVDEVFTSTTVRTRDTMFLLFGVAGTKPATEAEVPEFGESVRARPDEVEEPSLALRRPDVQIEEAEERSRTTGS